MELPCFGDAKLLLSFCCLFKLTYFNWRLMTLQYCGGFTTQWHESATGVHVSAILNPPPRSVPSPSCWAVPVLSAPFHASNLDWWSDSHMVIHTFQCYSPKSFPPSPSPIESKSLFFISVWRCQTFSLVEDTTPSVSDKTLPLQKVALWARLLCPAHKSASGSPQISYFSGAYILLQNI